MLAVTLFDLRFRARQFLIAVIGTALVFAIGLLNAGLANSFSSEVHQFTSSMGADRWLLPAGSTGPMTSFASLPASAVEAVRKQRGVLRADPLITVPYETVHSGSYVASGTLVGFVPGGIGDLAPVEGRDATAPGEAVIDRSFKLHIGSQFTIAGHTLRVVGISAHRTINGGVGIVSMRIDDARKIVFNGLALETVVVTKGVPAAVPAGLHAFTTAQIASDTLRPLRSPITSLQKSMEMMWVIAAVIVAALIYVSALERIRDFAVLKAIGSSTRAVFGGLAMQSVIVTVLGGGIALATANLMKPLFPLPVAIPTWAYVTLPAVAIVVGILSSLVVLRRAVSVDPSLAFSG
jgi:putative ABC transport system permease protein